MSKGCILVVEDEPINLETLVENLKEEGYDVLSADSGGLAWSLIEADPERLDVILLDRMLPDLDGIDVLRRVKAHPKLAHTPVVMQTGMTADEDVAEGLRAGAFYYLTKPFSADTLLAIVSAAASDRREHQELQRDVERLGHSLSCLESACFVFRTPDEARNIAAFAANAAPEASRVALGLSELMLNAIEHGNLEIGYDDKSRLIDNYGLQGEIERRLGDPQYQTRQARLSIERAGDVLRYLICDEGKGFDWQNYLEMSPERAFDTHGRGIAMSRMLSFDQLEYRGKGNEVVASIWLA